MAASTMFQTIKPFPLQSLENKPPHPCNRLAEGAGIYAQTDELSSVTGSYSQDFIGSDTKIRRIVEIALKFG